MASSAERLPVLDGLRAVSILLVLAAHMFPLGPKPFALNHTVGAMGMSLFFALSGFLITRVLLHNADILDFMVKRTARIVPLAYLYAFLVFTVLVFEPGEIFWTASFLINYFPEHLNEYNAHYWSLCVEIQFYAAIALVVLVAKTKGLWIVWPASLLITALRVSYGAYIDIQTHLRVDEILAGACVATIYDVSWQRWSKSAGSAVMVAAGLWFLSSSPHSGWVQYLRPYATGLVLSAVLCHDNTMLARGLSAGLLRHVAAMSYALYVIHPISVLGWWNQGSIAELYLLKRPISVIVTFVLALISTRYWERYWLGAAKSWSARRKLLGAHSTA